LPFDPGIQLLTAAIRILSPAGKASEIDLIAAVRRPERHRLSSINRRGGRFQSPGATGRTPDSGKLRRFTETGRYEITKESCGGYRWIRAAPLAGLAVPPTATPK